MSLAALELRLRTKRFKVENRGISPVVHTGAGFTIEYDIQLYFRRAEQLQLSWSDSR